MATRVHIASGEDFYLCPLNANQATREQLIEYLQPVWDEQQELTTSDAWESAVSDILKRHRTSTLRRKFSPPF